MPAEPRRLVEVALRYAEHGWPVLPLHTPRPRGCSRTAGDCGSPGKHPRTGRGLHGVLPQTCEQRTGSGGRQLLFAHPGGTVGNRARLVPGMDVRG
ncbi:MAG: hypothetical protein WDZ26_04295, partial [Nitriliruptoraceae bacterium]